MPVLRSSILVLLLGLLALAGDLGGLLLPRVSCEQADRHAAIESPDEHPVALNAPHPDEHESLDADLPVDEVFLATGGCPADPGVTALRLPGAVVGLPRTRAPPVSG